ncbi:hypothetical protein IQ218_09315 [Synechocystis salina LEGE 06099]|uniref:hypothetical protein n=1 Tax=Synechocystis salina TaxID=945780 RepID=UPI001882106D|nr:hypothetical protein [Synechocystis salina]MBE9203609.1 hypothetical protein [Synechocystis salina LEGE 06099]
MGILGTFIGIYRGLQRVGIGNIQNTQALLESSTTLLQGMKTAFATSLVGLSTASMMMIILAITTQMRRKARKNLRKQLSDIAYLESPQQLLSNLDQSSMGEAATSLQQVASSFAGLQNLSPENIAIAIQQVIKSEKNEIIQELTTGNLYLRSLTPEAIATALTPQISLLQNEVIQLRKIQEEQQTTVQVLVRELRKELIEPVVARLDQSAELTREASTAVRELKNELGGIAQSLVQAVQTIQEFQKDTLTRLQEFAQHLESILGEFRNDTQGVLNRVAIEINQAVAKSIEGMEAQREAFEASASQAASTFRGIREDLEAALIAQSTQQRQMLEDVQRSTERTLQEANRAFQHQSETLATVGAEASQLLNQAKDNLLETLSNIDVMLQNTRVTVQDGLQQFRIEYQQALTDFFKEQNNLLNDTLGQQRDGLAAVVLDLKNTFQEEAIQRKELSQDVNSSLQNIQETVAIVTNLTNAIGLNSNERLAQLEELARTIGDEARMVESSYKKMSNQYEQILEQITNEFNQILAQTNQQINDYLKNASETYSSNFQDADKAMSQICGQLNETSLGLYQVSQYLVASVNDLQSQKSGRN